MSDAQLTSKQVQILEWLQEQESQNPSADSARFGRFKQELFGKLESLDVLVPSQSSDAVTLLYSGKLGSTDSWRVAEEIGRASNGQVVTMGKTELGSMLNSRDFKESLSQVLGPGGKNLYNEIGSGIRPDGSTTPSIWDRASQRLAQAAHGDVRTLTQAAEDAKVFASKELPELLNNPKVTHINGVGMAQYRHIHANTPGTEADKLRAVNQAVQHTSFEIARDVKLDHTDHLVGPQGQQRLAREVHRVDPGKVFDGTPYTDPPRLSSTQATMDLSQGGSIESRGLEHAQRAREGARALEAAERATTAPHGRLPPGSVLKGLGVAGTAYGVAQGINDTRDAVEQARSNREQWVRGGEAGADVATRGVVTGAAATVGAIPGVAVGTLTSPVTGPAGPVGGALLTGGAAAYGADKAYQDSRLQTFAKAFGREVGELGYDFVSREGRLLREVNGLKQGLQGESDPARRQALETRLAGASERFSTEAERNGRYFDGRGAIEKGWVQTHAQFPKLDKDDVNRALSPHIDAGKSAAEAARAAYSDAVHEKYPRALPHQPAENYRALSNGALTERHSAHTQQLVEHRQLAQSHLANKDSHNNLDQGWPPALAERRQADRVESSLNAVWKDTGHVSAVREAMQARGMPLPELPTGLQRGRTQSPQAARDALRAHENRERSSEGATTARPAAQAVASGQSRPPQERAAPVERAQQPAAPGASRPPPQPGNEKAAPTVSAPASAGQPPAADRSGRSSSAVPPGAGARTPEFSSNTVRATSATHEHHFQTAQNRLTPGLRERGLDREEIERVSAAAVYQAQQHAGRGGIQGVYLSKDGQRVAVRQEMPPISEFNVNSALTQTKEQHLERAQMVAHTQAQPATVPRPERSRDAEPSPAGGPTAMAAPAAVEAPARAIA